MSDLSMMLFENSEPTAKSASRDTEFPTMIAAADFCSIANQPTFRSLAHSQHVNLVPLWPYAAFADNHKRKNRAIRWRAIRGS